MNIRYFLEFIKPNKIDKFLKNISSGNNDICICAGDIGNPLNSNNHYDIFMNFISKNFKKSFIIAGNHEYYNNSKTIQEMNLFLIDYFKQFNNITFLNNSYEYYENYCFIGTTLWSKITNPNYKINDMYNITHFDYIQYNELNKISKDFLQESLQEVIDNIQYIVITHHLLSNSLINDKYKTVKMLPYSQCFLF